MESHNSDTHLSSSITDLMTSLMVIFILLLLATISNRANEVEAFRKILLGKLQEKVVNTEFSGLKIETDPKDPNSILLIVPDGLMNFQTGKALLSLEGQNFLANYIPRLAATLCDPMIRNNIQSIVVEGYTDNQPYAGTTPELSQKLNLKLSQDRAMEVVKTALASLERDKAYREFFLTKLSASGRGEQDLQATAERSRRVIFKIRTEKSTIEEVKPKVQ